MSRRGTVLRGVALVGAGAGAAALARRARREKYDFYASLPVPGQPRLTGFGSPPWVFHDTASVQTVHGASFDAVRDLLPSADLHPVRLPDGRAVVAIVGARHHDITSAGVDGRAMPPYGEVLIAAAVTRRPAPPFLPLVAPMASGIAAGWFVLHLPVTTRAARDAGRTEWGYPKFIADMQFEESVVESDVDLSEGGREILRLTAYPSGRPSASHGPIVLYSVLDGQLIEHAVPSEAIRQLRWGAKGGHLELGDHQVADELRTLSIAPEPILTIRFSSQRMALVPGRSIGPASPYLGYIGEEREFGRYVVRYPGAAPIEMHPEAAPAAPVVERELAETTS